MTLFWDALDDTVAGERLLTGDWGLLTGDWAVDWVVDWGLGCRLPKGPVEQEGL